VQEVSLVWRDLGAKAAAADQGSRCAAKFQGVGSTAEERCSSIQLQVASISSGPGFLAPWSWAIFQCLISIRIDRGACSAEAEAEYLTAAVQTTSLTSLWLRATDVARVATALNQVQGTLQELALVLVWGQGSALSATAEATQCNLRAAIGRLSSVQRLELYARELSDRGLSIAIPESWSNLQSLQSLAIKTCANYGYDMDMASLFRLTHLTSLTLHNVRNNSRYEHHYHRTQLQPWSEGLRCLKLVLGVMGDPSVMTWSGFTSISALHLSDIVLTSHICR
jgi:hypothetical protein